jgi:hypothetical protein
MVLLIPMMMALLMAVAAMTVIGIVVLKEHEGVAVFHEERSDVSRRRL